MLIDVAPPQLQLKQHRTAPKPHLHITSPLGWLNDPCAPCYDPNSGLYHLFYQCNPNGVEWGDMSWGHATSKDMVMWKFGSRHTKLEPDSKYDDKGVFTGCMAPIAKDGTMTIFYSSICKLPFHWTSPAPRGSAGLAMATSIDEGRTWVKSDLNPILKAEPEGLKATGFRDPYLADWSTMDKIRGKKSLYGLISGGIEHSGPTSFIYAVDPTNLTKWEYLGPLVDMPERFSPSAKWNSNYGMNWECVNFMTLGDGHESREFLILGSEGDVQREHLVQQKTTSLPPNISPRPVRGQQWLAGDLTKKESSVQMQYRYGGILDHGVYYAANSFHDTKTNRRIVYGWIPEDDCTPEFANAKGWNGCQALPREIWLKVTPNVVKALHSRMEDISSSELVKQGNGLFTEYTLGIKPIDELKQLRDSALKTYHAGPFTLSPPSPPLKSPTQSPAPPPSISRPNKPKSTSTTVRPIAQTTSPTWELEATITLPNSATPTHHIHKLGLHIRSSPDNSVRTTVSFSPSSEKIQIDRTKSIPTSLKLLNLSDDNNTTPLGNFNTCTEEGPFTLFTHRTLPRETAQKSDGNSSNMTNSPPSFLSSSNGASGGGEITDKLESLNLRIIADGDVIEVFANDRFGLATMVYTGDAVYGGISAFVEYSHDLHTDTDSSSGTHQLQEPVDTACDVAFDVRVWDGLGRGLRYVGYDEDTYPVEVIERRSSRV